MSSQEHKASSMADVDLYTLSALNHQQRWPFGDHLHTVMKIKPQSPTRPLFCFFFSFWPHHTACVILVPRPGIKPGPQQ